MSKPPRPEFEAEYHFTHKGISYQGYFDPADKDTGYQWELDHWLPGLKGDELETVKVAFVDSLHCYPKKDQDKFLWPWYKYTPRDSTTAAYKTLFTRVMGFSIASTLSTPIPPKPPQLPWDKPKDPERGNGGENPDNENPKSPHSNRGGDPPDREGGGPPGGGGGGGGGPGRPPPRPQQTMGPTQALSRIRRVKIKAPDVFNRDQEQTQIFLDQLYLLFKEDPDKYQTDNAKIATAMSYIKGPNVT